MTTQTTCGTGTSPWSFISSTSLIQCSTRSENKYYSLVPRLPPLTPECKHCNHEGGESLIFSHVNSTFCNLIQALWSKKVTLEHKTLFHMRAKGSGHETNHTLCCTWLFLVRYKLFILISHMYCTLWCTDHCWSDGPNVSPLLLWYFHYVSFAQIGSGGVTHEFSPRPIPSNTHTHTHTHTHVGVSPFC